MRVEIIHHRDPDYGCAHEIFIDGVRVDTPGAVAIEIFDVDPGAGYTADEWEIATRLECDLASPAAAAFLRDLREDVGERSEYVR